MNTREHVCVAGTPFKWTTNLTDEEIREFHALYGKQIAEPDHRTDTSSTTIVIPIRMDFLPFREGFCFWCASREKHTVLYRSNRDWELWDARQKEIEELRQEQAAEEAVEKTLVINEDAHLREKTELAIGVGDYDGAAACVTARAELRKVFKRFRVMPVQWSCWYEDLIFARFPTSRHGIEFIRHYNNSPGAFSNFAHWFSVRCGLTGEALVEQTRAIFDEGMRMFPESGSLAQAKSLFFRRVGKYGMAMAVCVDAIKRGLRDGTKSGFEGRLKRLERESQNARLRS